MKALYQNLIKYCTTSNDSNDSDQLPVQQITYLGKAGDAYVLLPYGFHANPPKGFLGLLLSVLGQEDNRVFIPLSPKERPTLESGEVVMYHPLTGDKVHFLNDGTIEITSQSKVTLNVPDAELTGNLTVKGNTTVEGDTTLGANVTSNGKDISDTHQHSGVTSGGANTGVPV